MLFKINFQFQGHLTCLSGFQMDRSFLGTRSGSARWRMDFFQFFFLRRLSCGVSQLLEGAGWVQLTFGAKTYQHNRYPDIYESIDGLHIAFCLHCPNYKVRIPKQLQEKSEAAMRTLKQSVSKGART